MKYLGVGFILSLAFNYFGQTQELSVGSAYHISAPNSFVGTKKIDVLSNDFSLSKLRGSMGSGLDFSLTWRRKKTENFSFALSYNYLLGNKVLMREINSKGTFQEIIGQSYQHKITPQLAFHLNGEHLQFVIETGLIIPISTQSVLQNNYRGLDGSELSYALESEQLYKFAFGYQQSIGFNTSISKNFSLGANFGFQLLQLALKSEQIKKYEVDQVDQLASLNTYQRETIFHEDINNFSNNESFNQTYNFDSPKDELTYSNSFNTIFLALKVVYCFPERVQKIK